MRPVVQGTILGGSREQEDHHQDVCVILTNYAHLDRIPNPCQDIIRTIVDVHHSMLQYAIEARSAAILSLLYCLDCTQDGLPCIGHETFAIHAKPRAMANR